MKKLLSALVALSLSSCASLPADGGFNINASTTSVRNHAGQALIVAMRGVLVFDAAFRILLTTPAGHPVIAPGSTLANQIADALDRARHALNAAADALRAGNSAGFAAAMGQAEGALSEAHAAVGNNHG